VHNRVVLKSLVNEIYILFVLVGSQSLSGVYSLVLPKCKGNIPRIFARSIFLSRKIMLWNLV
jgi:hypothetical protein